MNYHILLNKVGCSYNIMEKYGRSGIMATKLYVGNLSYSTDNEGLQRLFSEYGALVSASVIVDRQTGTSKGFGFVEFEDDSCAKKAVSVLNGREVDGRRIRVSEARERPDRQ